MTSKKGPFGQSDQGAQSIVTPQTRSGIALFDYFSSDDCTYREVSASPEFEYDGGASVFIGALLLWLSKKLASPDSADDRAAAQTPAIERTKQILLGGKATAYGRRKGGGDVKPIPAEFWLNADIDILVSAADGPVGHLNGPGRFDWMEIFLRTVELDAEDVRLALGVSYDVEEIACDRRMTKTDKEKWIRAHIIEPIKASNETISTDHARNMMCNGLGAEAWTRSVFRDWWVSNAPDAIKPKRGRPRNRS